jgi:Hydantoinase B/oxoprolinase
MKFVKQDVPRATADAVPAVVASVYFENGRALTPCYISKDLTFGHVVSGPAVVIDSIGTIVVEPHCTLRVTQHGDFVIDVGTSALLRPMSRSVSVSSPQSPPSLLDAPDAATDAALHLPAVTEFVIEPTETAVKSPGISSPGSAFSRPRRSSCASHSEFPETTVASQSTPTPSTAGRSLFKHVTTALDPIQLSIFSHRFMSIAEQMGRTLQRTSVSVNIKERLDFSCAIFGPDGGLVANAPHIPVHLGAMQEAVKFQREYWGDRLSEGDVLVSNHPQLAGGSHLPDITVITPVWDSGVIVFWVASRGHHADIGGISPGSMPPQSKTLAEEGAAIVSFKLVENGVFQVVYCRVSVVALLFTLQFVVGML